MSSIVIRSDRQCGGKEDALARSPPASHGCRWATMSKTRTWRASSKDTQSLLWLYRRLIALRRNTPALTTGDYQPLRSRNDILCSSGCCRGQEILVAANVAQGPRRLDLPNRGVLLLSTALDR
jgi:Domain of unknown function (DUF3459)